MALHELGYDGGDDAIRRYARIWWRQETASSASAYVPLSFAPGEACQFDWSHEIVLIDGVTVTVTLGHVRRQLRPAARGHLLDEADMTKKQVPHDADHHDGAGAILNKGQTR